MTQPLDKALAALHAQCRGAVLTHADECARFGHDFGGMYERMPAIVVQPVCEQDVTLVLRTAAEHGVAVSTRGCGHSQSGQGLGSEIVLDMRSLDRGLQVDAAHGCMEVQAGARWCDVLPSVFEHGLIPVGLTHALDTSLAGTLSVAGIGAETHRYGPQVDNVAYLDVATVDAGIVRCSSRDNPALFDAVRSGLGQCGVIVRVGYPLRRVEPCVSTACYVYADPERYLQDLQRLAADAHAARWLTGTVVRDPVRRGRCMLLLFVGMEHALGTAPALPELHSDWKPRVRTTPLWHASGETGHPFFRVFAQANRALHPWVEHLFAPLDAVVALTQLMDSVLSGAAGTGTAAVIPVRRGAQPAPLFVTPETELAIGLGLLACFDLDRRADADALTRAYVAKMAAARSGKRYLSGYFSQLSAADWAEHYGARWSGFRHAKARFDPTGLLNPGFVQFRS